jgi:hypothetical protein
MRDVLWRTEKYRRGSLMHWGISKQSLALQNERMKRFQEKFTVPITEEIKLAGRCIEEKKKAEQHEKEWRYLQVH